MVSNRPYIYSHTHIPNQSHAIPPISHTTLHFHILSSMQIACHTNTSLLQTLDYPLLIYVFIYVKCMLLLLCVYCTFIRNSEFIFSRIHVLLVVNFTLETFTIINCALYLELNHSKWAESAERNVKLWMLAMCGDRWMDVWCVYNLFILKKRESEWELSVKIIWIIHNGKVYPCTLLTFQSVNGRRLCISFN